MNPDRHDPKRDFVIAKEKMEKNVYVPTLNKIYLLMDKKFTTNI